MQTCTIRHLSAALIETSPDGAASVGAGVSGHGERVETTEDFAPALNLPLGSYDSPLIHAHIYPATMPPTVDETSCLRPTTIVNIPSPTLPTFRPRHIPRKYILCPTCSPVLIVKPTSS